jgi:hypothetical protein
LSCRLTAGWVRASSLAARETEPSRAIVMNSAEPGFAAGRSFGVFIYGDTLKSDNIFEENPALLLGKA